ncbi:MAG: hypothetical protein JWQ76_3318 [Ramlibacter sp.]|nr:hypothetical protein [Ramlibacter sp.]
MRPILSSLRPVATLALLAGAGALGGCTVIAVAGAAASVAVTGASLAVDAAVGTVKITGKAVGMAVDAVLPSGDK